MPAAEIKVNAKEFRHAVRAIPQAWRREARKAMTVGAGLFKAEFFRRRSARKRSATGEMARSSKIISSQVGGSEAVTVGIYGLPYPGILEGGGTIRANGAASVCGKGRMLAIPLGPAKTAAGQSRGSPCHQAGLFMIRSRAGKLLLVKRQGNGIVPWYVLQPSVRIPASLGFERGWKSYGRRLILDELREARLRLVRAWRTLA